MLERTQAVLTIATAVVSLVESAQRWRERRAERHRALEERVAALEKRLADASAKEGAES